MKDKKMIWLSVVCAVSILVMCCTLFFVPKGTAKFVPPPFDTTAQEGIPQNTGESYTRIYKDGMPFSAHLCADVIKNGDKAYVNFTNDSDNTVWMKLRILNAQNEIIGESGLLKPNSFVETIPLQQTGTETQSIQLKIMAYEPETYYSAGSVSLRTTLSNGGV